MTRPWTSTPEATALLADLASTPPSRCLIRGTFNHAAPYFAPDPRMKRLRAIYANAEPVIDTAEWQEWLRSDPVSVVRGMVEDKRGMAA